MFYLVCFDIADDHIRYRVVKVLKGYGVRVQKSVFECSSLTEEQFLKLKHRIEECIDATQDSIRYYLLCKKCIRNVEYSGLGELPSEVSYKVC